MKIVIVTRWNADFREDHISYLSVGLDNATEPSLVFFKK